MFAVPGGQRKSLNLLKLKLQTDMSCHAELGPKPKIPARVSSALNC